LRAFLEPESGGFILYQQHHSAPHPQFPDQEAWSWDNLGGLSIYLPLLDDEWKRRHYTAKFLRAAADGYWNDFLAAYHDYVEPPADPLPCVDCTPLGPEPIQGSVQEPVFVPVLVRE